MTGVLRVSERVKWAGIVLIVLVGLVHLVESPEYFEFATYLGLSFVANTLSSLLAAVGIYRHQRWGWILGLLIAALSFVLYVISRSVGLPGLPHKEWLEPTGIVSVLAEVLFVVLAGYQVANAGKAPTAVHRADAHR
jgi:uncharacterized membrane protein YfcA